MGAQVRHPGERDGRLHRDDACHLDAVDGRPVRIELRRGTEPFWECALAYGAGGLLEREGELSRVKAFK